ncbi:18321_t:CDS:1 [Rhizophagus irregularis]|nr:18321_t:CDS:1 [Rhizophagus irregularis]
MLNSIISIGFSNLYNQFLLQQEIYKLLMRKCPELKYLNIKSIKHQIFYFPEAKTKFESLFELKCDTTIDISYFYGLAHNCQYIQRLIIINNKLNINHGTVKLIENQRNLKYFEWKDDFENDDIVEYPYIEIFLVLEKKADVLNHLILSTPIIKNVLTKFYKLKTLIINDYVPFSEDQLKMSAYRELETFNIDFISLNEASIIIENSGGHIREILLRYIDYEYWYDNLVEDSLNFICKIYQNCPLIEYLSLLFPSTTDHFIEFEKLLKGCQILKSLLLNIPNNDKEETGDELLKILIRSAPTNLREIRFFNDFKFSLNNLEKFFKNWKDRPALSILTTDPIYKGDDYMKLINKYKDNGVIKEFRCDSRNDDIQY